MQKFNQVIRAVLIFSLSCSAFSLSCPSYDQIKATHFSVAKQHNLDPDLWYLFSQPFQHNERMWNVSYGTFFYGEVLTALQALNKGQDFFDHSPLKKHHPTPIWLPGWVLCDYMTEGSDYLVSAVSPPQFQIDQ